MSLALTDERTAPLQCRNKLRALPPLTTAQVCTVVHVQHLSGNVTSFRQVNDRASAMSVGSEIVPIEVMAAKARCRAASSG